MDIERFNTTIDECWNAFMNKDKQAFARSIEKLRAMVEAWSTSATLLEQAHDAYPHVAAMHYITHLSNQVLDSSLTERGYFARQ